MTLVMGMNLVSRVTVLKLVALPQRYTWSRLYTLTLGFQSTNLPICQT